MSGARRSRSPGPHRPGTLRVAARSEDCALASPQTGIFALGTSSHAWLEFDVLPSASPADAVALVASLREPRTTIDGVNLVVGFRPEVWAQVAPDAAPPGAAGFDRPVTGPTGQIMPATQHDIVVWLTGSGYDVVFDVSRAIVAALAAHATLATRSSAGPITTTAT